MVGEMATNILFINDFDSKFCLPGPSPSSLVSQSMPLVKHHFCNEILVREYFTLWLQSIILPITRESGCPTDSAFHEKVRIFGLCSASSFIPAIKGSKSWSLLGLALSPTFKFVVWALVPTD